MKKYMEKLIMDINSQMLLLGQKIACRMDFDLKTLLGPVDYKNRLAELSPYSEIQVVLAFYTTII